MLQKGALLDPNEDYLRAALGPATGLPKKHVAKNMSPFRPAILNKNMSPLAGARILNKNMSPFAGARILNKTCHRWPGPGISIKTCHRGADGWARPVGGDMFII